MADKQPQVRLLIICRKKSDYKDMIKFLSRRGWAVAVMQIVSDAIDFLMKHEPNVVMVSFNHPNKKIHELPRVIEKASGAEIIGYAEVYNREVANKLAASGLKNIMYPPISGPAIERRILAIIDQKEKDGESFGKPLKKKKKKKKSKKPSLKRTKAKTDNGEVLQPTRPKKKSKGPEIVGPQGVKKKPQKPPQIKKEVLNKISQKALNTAVNVTDGPVTEIDETDQVSVITVDSPSVSGYLIVALGPGKILDEETLQKINENFIKTLKDEGIKINANEVVDLQMENVEFKKWAEEYADFLNKSSHDGDEIAMAFFPTESVVDELEPSEKDNLIQVNIASIEPDTPVDFDIYIHLPVNDRYVLFTKKGGQLLGKQKNKLTNRGMDKFHINKDDVDQFKGHKMKSFLKEKVSDFKGPQEQSRSTMKKQQKKKWKKAS